MTQSRFMRSPLETLNSSTDGVDRTCALDGKGYLENGNRIEA